MKQALEELVRKNVLYYDDLSLKWRLIEKIEDIPLQDFLSDDIVTMVRNKLQTLPPVLQTALDLLFALVKRYSQCQHRMHQSDAKSNQSKVATKLSFSDMETLLRLAFKEGLLLRDVASRQKKKHSSTRIKARR